LASVSAEAADVAIMLVSFCDRIGIDLLDAMQEKIAVNRRNYPAAQARGRFERPGGAGTCQK
jgi:NTP pyrophosphatase (non-canonical NTP hydrolase)